MMVALGKVENARREARRAQPRGLVSGRYTCGTVSVLYTVCKGLDLLARHPIDTIPINIRPATTIMAKERPVSLVAPVPSEDPKKKDEKSKSGGGDRLNGKEVADKLNDKKNQLHELVGHLVFTCC